MNVGTRAATSTVVYVANASSNEILGFTLDPSDGRLRPIARLGLATSVGSLTASRDGRFLFAAVRGGETAVISLAIGRDGVLQQIAEATMPDHLAYLSTDRSGRYLFGASYTGALFTINAVDDDGRVAPQPLQVTTTPPHAHCALVDPTNRYLYVTSLGGDVILQYRFDPTTGRATPASPPVVPAPKGSGPRHVVFGSHGNVVYVNGELDGTIGVYALDSASGGLTAVQHLSIMPDRPPADPWAADLALTPDGRFLYASERRTGTICLLRVDTTSGRLERITNIPTEPRPRAIALDPSGRFLLVAGETSNTLVSYAVDAAVGTLHALQRYAIGEKPVWICAMSLPSPLE